MKIKFTITLSARTVKAFEEQEGLTTGLEIKDRLVEALQEVLEEVKSNIDDAADDEQDQG